MFKRKKSFDYITKKEEYDKVFTNGKTKHTDLFIVKETQSEKFGFGIIVSKKCGNSVQRHAIKRKIREVFIKRRETWLLEKKIVIVAKPKINKAPFQKIEQEILQCIM